MLQPELCDGVDNDCNGVIDDPEVVARLLRPCPLQEGVCEGAVERCHEGRMVCDGEVHGPDYRLADIDCDCLDNNCDGVVDGERDGRGLGDCGLDDFDEAARLDPTRECVVQQGGVPRASSHFFAGDLRVLPEVRVVAPPRDDGSRCGYPGGAPPGGAATLGGGCLALAAGGRLLVEGELDADGTDGVDNGSAGGGGTPGDRVMLSYGEPGGPGCTVALVLGGNPLGADLPAECVRQE